MVITETVEVDISVNKQKLQKEFNDVRDDIKWFTNRLESDEASELSLNVSLKEKELRELRNRLKKAIAEENATAEIEIRADIARLQQGLTQSKRELRNFVRTWDKEVSVLGKLFDWVNSEIKKTRDELKALWKDTSKLDALSEQFRKWEISAEKFNKELDKIKPTKFDKITSSAKKTAAAFGLVFAVDKLLEFWRALLSLSSDLEETTSKFNVIFDWINKEATDAFDSLADRVWRSRLDIKRFGAELADVLKPLWFTTEEALWLSEQMTQLAIDVASFNNVSDAQAINAFRSAITWEREALKSLGIVINEADVKTEAYTSWLALQGAELTKTQKAQATYNLLLKNSTDAQGDAERTSWSYANVIKKLQGRFTDVWAALGQKVLPIFSKLAEIIISLIDTTTKYSKEIWFLFWAVVTLISAKWLLWLFNILTKLIPVIKWTVAANWLLTLSSNSANVSISLLSKTTLIAIRNFWLFATAIWWVIQAFEAYKTALDLISATDAAQAAQDSYFSTQNKRIEDVKNNIKKLKSENEKLFKSDTQNSQQRIKINEKLIEAEQKFLKTAILWLNINENNAKTVKDLTDEWIELRKEAEKLAKQYWINIDTQNEFNDSQEKWLKTINDLKWNIEDLTNQLNSATIWSEDFNKIQKEIETEQARLDKVLWKSATTEKENIKTQIELEKERQEKYEKFLEERNAKIEEQTKREIELAETAQSEIDKAIDKSKDNIESYKDKIKSTTEAFKDYKRGAIDEIQDINNSLENLDKDRASSLAQRILEIQEEIKALDESWKFYFETVEERKKLEEELALARKNTTQTAIDEAKKQAQLSPTEEILQEIQAEKTRLENRRTTLQAEILLEQEKTNQEIALLNAKVSNEEEQLESLAQLRINTEAFVTARLSEEANKQIESTQKVIDKVKELIELKKEAWLTWTVETPETNDSTNWDNTASWWNTINLNIWWVTVTWEADEDRLIEKIKQALIDAQKNAERWIY